MSNEKQKVKALTKDVEVKFFPPCPYPDFTCELSMMGKCCLECEHILHCEKVCKNNPSNHPHGCGRYEKGKKRNVE